MVLPHFEYHPDPVATGSIVQSDTQCVCCGGANGFIYVGSVYAEEDLAESICPWCIAENAAHEKFDAEFVCIEGVSDYGSWERVSPEVVEEVAFRTPGFNGWQQERWWTHCGDAASFLCPVGWRELESYGPEAITVFREEVGLGRYGMDTETYLKALNRQHGPTGYLFQCRHCGKFGGYSDCH